MPAAVSPGIPRPLIAAEGAAPSRTGKEPVPRGRPRKRPIKGSRGTTLGVEASKRMVLEHLDRLQHHKEIFCKVRNPGWLFGLEILLVALAPSLLAFSEIGSGRRSPS